MTTDQSSTTVPPGGLGYGPAAEFLDLFLRPVWERLGPALTPALQGLPDGAVLDLGSGTGAALPWIAAAAPGRAVLALEPQDALRTVLLSRAAADPELRTRVTVLTGAFPATPLPTGLAAVVVGNAFGHFDEPTRREFWRRCAEVLPAGGRVVCDVSPGEEPAAVAPSAGAPSVQVGARRYRTLAAAEVTGPDILRWRMTYQVLEVAEPGRERPGERVVEERVTSYDWHVVGPRRAGAEAAAWGFVPAAVPGPEGTLVLEFRPAGEGAR